MSYCTCIWTAVQDQCCWIIVAKCQWPESAVYLLSWTQPRPPVNMISEWVYPCPITCNWTELTNEWTISRSESDQSVHEKNCSFQQNICEKDTTLSLSCHISLQSGCYLYKADSHWIRQHNVSPIMAQFAQNHHRITVSSYIVLHTGKPHNSASKMPWQANKNFSDWVLQHALWQLGHHGSLDLLTPIWMSQRS